MPRAPQQLGDGNQLSVREAIQNLSFNQLGELIANMELRRAWWNQTYIERRKNINQECGYPATEEITCYNYWDLYEREPIAARVVDIYPDECWQVTPQLYEHEDENATPFEQAWDDLGLALNQGTVWKDDDNNPIWQYLVRADKLCGVGRYGAILLGLSDGKALSEPVDEGGGGKLLFMRVLDESHCVIAATDDDMSSERFGKPTMYNVSITTASQLSSPLIKTASVHWTRIVHIVDNPLIDGVLGMPRMQRAYNRLYDLHKLYGGSAEMYWQGALPPISFETHPQLGGQVTVDVEMMKDQVEKLFTGLQRSIALPGMTANSLAPSVVDPSPQIERELEALCIYLNVPKRVFMGSERGELSSGQDMRVWYGRCKGRQEGFITPSIIVPFVDHLIWLGILPKPAEYYVSWPDISVATDEEEANVSNVRTTMLSTYAQSQIPMILTPRDFLVRVAKFDEAEVDEMLANAEAELEANAAMMAAGQPQEFDEEGNPIEAPVPPLAAAMGAEGVTGTGGEAALGAEGVPVGEETGTGGQPNEDGEEPTGTGDGATGTGGEEEPTGTGDTGTGGVQNIGCPWREIDTTRVLKVDTTAIQHVAQNIENVFCPTGEGGGIDPTCSPVGTELNEEQATKLVQKIRAGDARSKNKGVPWSTEPSVKEPMVVSRVPISLFDRLSNPDHPEDGSYFEFLESSTDQDRVGRYSNQQIATPIVVGVGAKSGNAFISDGAHRLLAARTRGDSDIPALVPKSLFVKLHSVHNAEHKFSCVYFELPKMLADMARAFSLHIQTADLHEEGREENPHLTVKYGIHTHNMSDVMKVVALEQPVKVKLGRTSVFHKDDCDVVKIGVSSLPLRALNHKISKELECTDKYPRYSPHITIAYVKKGMGDKYAGIPLFEGVTETLDRLVFQAPDGTPEIHVLEPIQNASGCGAGSPGGKGFAPGNTCAADKGGDFGGGSNYEQTMSGEYWLDGGTSLFADGDIGDMNHEGYAIDQAQRNVIDAMGNEYSEFNIDEVDWDGFIAKLEETYNESDEDDEAYLDAITEAGITEAEFETAMGRGDPRAFAVEAYGWTRLAGNSMQTGAINSSKLKEIADGLSSAFDMVDEEEFNKQSYNLETKTAYYTEVPYHVFEDGDMKALRDYKSHGTPGWGGVSNKRKSVFNAEAEPAQWEELTPEINPAWFTEEGWEEPNTGTAIENAEVVIRGVPVVLRSGKVVDVKLNQL